MSAKPTNPPLDQSSRQSQNQMPRLVLREDDLLSRLLRDLRLLLMRNPESARMLTQFLVAEGRRFASTPAGERWQQSLAQSELVSRGRMIWQAYGLDSLLDVEPVLTPSDWIRLIATELANADLEATLSKLMREGTVDGPVNSVRP